MSACARTPSSRAASRPITRWLRLLPAALAFAFASAAPAAPPVPALPPAAAAPAVAAEPAAAPACTAPSLLPGLRASGVYAEQARLAAAVPNGEGRVYRLRKEGKPVSFLFGTMHLSDPRILALPQPVRQAYDAVDTLVIETTDILGNTMSQLAIVGHPDLINLPAGKKLDDFLDPAQQETLTAALEAAGIPLQAVETLQPWFLGMGIMIPSCEAARLAKGAPTLDVALASIAAEDGKTVLGLETGVEQMQALASMPIRLQVDSLIATLLMKDKLPAIFETMTELYLAGQIALITPLAEAAIPEASITQAMIDGNKAFEERVITRRNHVMAERLLPILAKGKIMVAVGALHLPGEEGLVELLRAEGFVVEKLE